MGAFASREAAGRVLITPRSLTATGHPSLDRLRAAGFEVVCSTPGRQPDEAELARLVPQCVGWLAGVEPVSPAVIRASARLRAISRNGVGTDNLPMDVITERGIVVRTAAGANAAGVAELALGLMFACLRHIPLANAGIKAGGWPRLRGGEIRGREIGLVGCGAIGQEVARLVTALGARVIAFDPMQPDFGLPADRFGYAGLHTVIERAQILTLHCPPPKDGRALIGEAEIARMRPGAFVVNTARAGLVDEPAMLAGLDSGRIGAFATDVFPQEPPRALSLAGHPRVIATSHIGGFTDESVDRATDIAVTNLLESLAEAGADGR